MGCWMNSEGACLPGAWDTGRDCWRCGVFGILVELFFARLDARLGIPRKCHLSTIPAHYLGGQGERMGCRESALASRQILLLHVWDPNNTLHHRIKKLALPSQCDSQRPGYRSRAQSCAQSGRRGFRSLGLCMASGPWVFLLSRPRRSGRSSETSPGPPRSDVLRTRPGGASRPVCIRAGDCWLGTIRASCDGYLLFNWAFPHLLSPNFPSPCQYRCVRFPSHHPHTFTRSKMFRHL